jgi:hypothetical protein
MRTTGPQNPYEIYCYQCNVTAPVGSRRCVHCGGRFGRQRMPQPDAVSAVPFEPLIEEDETPSNLPERLGNNLPTAIVWILLLVGGSLFRLCN